MSSGVFCRQLFRLKSGPLIPHGLRFWHSSLEESSLPWKRFPGEGNPTASEYASTAQSLSTHLARRYTVSSFKQDGDLYVRGDFFGDRTRYVEMVLPELISPLLVSYLQLWLRVHDDGAWRIMIPTYVGTATAILIYPEVVRLGVEWEADLNDAYVTIAQMMRSSDQSGTYRKK